MKTTFRLERRGDETWRDCVVRYATPYQLTTVCLHWFDKQREQLGDAEAAWEALYEWDLIPVVEVPEEGDV